MAKRKKKYEAKLSLKENVEFDDLIKVSLQAPVKKSTPVKKKKAKR